MAKLDLQFIVIVFRPRRFVVGNVTISVLILMTENFLYQFILVFEHFFCSLHGFSLLTVSRTVSRKAFFETMCEILAPFYSRQFWLLLWTIVDHYQDQFVWIHWLQLGHLWCPIIRFHDAGLLHLEGEEQLIFFFHHLIPIHRWFGQRQFGILMVHFCKLLHFCLRKIPIWCHPLRY